ncbi:MAG: flagellar basal body P-ring formation protein FlgA [Pseudomonadota bacterium]|nr:flagella basal body P-ring formation protein FlgA [Pseudomonadota bacterium]QKK04924.1 MAG: flagellar basal body P-ring formation protein FlgA [Pseudomonadota bacterium]
MKTKNNKVKKKLWLTAATLSCAVMLFGATAKADVALPPQNEVRLAGDVLTLGDVFQDVKNNAGHVLAPAPAPGKTIILTAADLQRIADAFHISWQPDSSYTRLIVRRDAAPVSPAKISEALKKKLASIVGGSSYEIDLDKRFGEIYINGTTAPEISVTNMDVSPAGGRFAANLSLTTPQLTKNVNITGMAHRVLDVPVLNRRLRNGDVIEASDIEFIRMRADNVAESAILDPEKLIGQTPRRVLDAMETVLPDNIAAPLAVKKGEYVTLFLTQGGLHLTARGKALENGAAGDVVRVVNTASSRIIEGEVVGAQSVRIAAAM